MLTREQLQKKKIGLEKIAINSHYPLATGKGGLYHYISVSTLFSMLENDSFWVTGTRFSNDSSEERVFPSQCMASPLNDDNYMFCLSENGDCLSQWRGYCYHGGAAIKLNLSGIREYSVLHADYDTSGKYEIVQNAPIPILYVPVLKKHFDEFEEAQELELERQFKDLWDRLTELNLPMESLVPQFKNNKFEEERELRLLFENYHNELAQCIRFRTMKSKIKVPYMVIRMGDIAKRFTRCEFDVSRFEGTEGKERLIDEFVNKGKSTICIPQGSNQESVYYRMEKIIDNFNNANIALPLKIECEGHLPIEEIIVAPTYDRERKAEQIQRYCWSKYWLRQVKIGYSEIPYIPPSEIE